MAGKLSGRQQKALRALLSESTIVEAAQAAGCAERTLYRWLGDPAFQAAYQKVRREAVSRAVGRLQQAACVAVDTLEEITSNQDAPAAARVAAAKTILEMAVKGIELEDLAERVKALEQDTEGEP